MYENLAIVAVFAFLFSAFAGILKGTSLSGPMIFMTFGLVFGPVVLGIYNPAQDSEVLRTLADLTLAVVLFIDAAGANLGILRRNYQIPGRMLLIGLPLTILLGFGIGVFFFDNLTYYEIAILATILAATDAALGKAVVTNKAVPASIREGLNVESGMNDGLCVPILFIFLALSQGSVAEEGNVLLALELVFEEIGIGLIVGMGVTAIGTWILIFCSKHGWITEVWEQIPIIALSMACFAIAQNLHGSGYIAAFSGGILLGALAKNRKEKHRVLLSAEGTAETLALITWVFFGAAVVGQFFNSFSWEIVIYSLLSLTVVRMLPVFISLWGSGQKTTTKLFLGWFGPRGLASIVFTIIVVNKNIPGEETIAFIVVCTVFLSIVLHGFSANPLAKAFGTWFQKQNK
jgi:NhaP-type Na+/H+ or K+/H+ antiporter